MDNIDKNIALAGVPNCGKTTLFNALTGSRQRIGNWEGVTVEKIEGKFKLGENSINLLDLPGTSDLNADTDDQRVAHHAIKNDNFDWILNIVDATHLNQSLFLTLDILKITPNVIILLNMMDIAERENIEIDSKKLSEELGVPVIPIISTDKNSIKSALDKVETLIDYPTNLEDNRQFFPDDTETKYKAIDDIIYKVLSISQTESLTDKIDKIVLNKYASGLIFLAAMFLTFWFSIGVGSVFIDFFDIIAGLLFIELPTIALEYLNSPEWLVTILPGGVGAGLQTVATFIPVVFFMFMGLSILESVGYMARIAVIADRMLRKIGLPGNAFLPLLVGFGCTVPAVMATRTLKSKREKFLTIFMSSFMSCGARLPVYAVFSVAIFGPYSGLAVFLIYLSGILMAVLTGFLLKNSLFKGNESTFSINLPLYHRPKMLSIIKRSYLQLKQFVKKAGVIITIAVFILTFFNMVSYKDGEISFNSESIEYSLLAHAGKTVAPVFKPMGVVEENWPASVALFTGLFAKEAIVGTVNSLYTTMGDDRELQERDELEIGSTILEALATIKDGFVGVFSSVDILGVGITTEDKNVIGEELETNEMVFSKIAEYFTMASGFAYLLFVLIYFPCLAVIGAARQEMNMSLAMIMASYSTILAWSVATLFYQVAEGHNLLFIVLPIVIMVITFYVLKIMGNSKGYQKIYHAASSNKGA